MHAFILALVLAVGTLGAMTLAPSQAQAQDVRPDGNTYVVAWRGGWGGRYWRGGSRYYWPSYGYGAYYYPRYSYGYYGSYYPGYNYYPRYYYTPVVPYYYGGYYPGSYYSNYYYGY
jgi:hypothetical protein